MNKYFRFIKKHGMKGIVDKIKEKIYEKLYIYDLEIGDYTLEKDTGLSVKLMDRLLLDQMYAANKNEISPEKYQDFLRRIQPDSNIETYVCMDEKGQILGHASNDYGTHYEEDILLYLPDEPDSVYMYDGWVFSVSRGSGLLKFMVTKMLKDLKDKGYRIAYTMVKDGNRPSEKTVEKFGFRKCYKVMAYRLPFYKKTFTTKL